MEHHDPEKQVIKTQQTKYRREFLHLRKGIYKTPTAIILFNKD